MATYQSPGVYVEEVPSGARPIEGVGTAVAAFVGAAERGPVNEPTLIANWGQFTETFGEFVDGSYLAHAVYGYFMNGGGVCYVVRVGADTGPSTKATGELPRPEDASVGTYQVNALESGEPGNEITVEVTTSGSDDDEDEDTFDLKVKRGGETVEEFTDLTVGRGGRNAAAVINRESQLIRLASPTGRGVDLPSSGSVELRGGGRPDTGEIDPEDYVGDVADRTGLGGISAVEEITMVACPDLMAAYRQGSIDLDAVQAVQQAMIAHCENLGDRLAILDPPPGLDAQQIREWRVEKVGYDSDYAALYWPWVEIMDPAAGERMPLPPSGHVAGIYARTDAERGVHKAPANEVVRGAIDLEARITRDEHDLLNPEGINCIRAFPGRGIRVWGARTLSSDPAWRYLNVRRLFNYLEESILNGTQWTVFEPNDHALWAKIRRTVSAFLTNEWRKGALFGLTPDEAFYVKCDEETNPPDQVDAGIVVCEIGVAPVKPAEFVVFRLSQFSGGGAIEE